MRVYMTGGTGFIGSYVLYALSKAGHEVICLARSPRKVPGLAKLPGVSIIKADMYDTAAIKKIMKKPDALVHVALCWGDTGPEMIQNETLNSVKLIDIAVSKGAKKVIFTSSTAAMGPLNKDTDESGFRKPSDFYGATKGAVELFMSAYSYYNKKIKFNVIRPGYTFGNPVVPGADTQPDKRFNDICKKAVKGKSIEVIKHDGTQFIWAGDLAKIYIKVLASASSNNIYFGLGKIFTTWDQIARWAVEFAGSKSRIKVKNLGWSPKPRLFKLKKIKNEFGLAFSSQEKLKEHIKYLLAYIK